MQRAKPIFPLSKGRATSVPLFADDSVCERRPPIEGLAPFAGFAEDSRHDPDSPRAHEEIEKLLRVAPEYGIVMLPPT